GGPRLQAASVPRKLGKKAGERQGVLHGPGPPRRRLDEPAVSGNAPGSALLVRGGLRGESGPQLEPGDAEGRRPAAGEVRETGEQETKNGERRMEELISHSRFPVDQFFPPPFFASLLQTLC